MAADSLLLDIGNSRVKWGIARFEQIISGEPFSSRPDCLNTVLTCLWAHLPPPRSVWVSCVARPEVAMALERWIGRHWNCPVYHAQSAASACGVSNAYREPCKLGVDRWLSLIAVRQSCTEPVCIAGCGTALTVDLLDAGGRHLGGMISPGLKLMHDALTGGADRLKNIQAPIDFSGDSTQATDGLAQTTGDAITLGCLEAGLGLIERVYHRFVASHPGQGRLILTGGDAPVLARHLAVSCQVEPDLVLKGLYRLSRSSPVPLSRVD